MGVTDWRTGLHAEAVQAVELALAPDETVELVLHGLSNQAIIATGRRALVFKKGFMAGASFGSELTSWTYRSLVGVQIHTGLMSGAVVLQGPGQSGLKTSTWQTDEDDPYKAPNAIPLGRPFDGAKQRVARLARLIDDAHGVAPRDSAPRTSSTTTTSAADELRKLADLRAEGVLSDEEFERLKTRVVSGRSG